MRNIMVSIFYFLNRDFRYYYYGKMLKNIRLSKEKVFDLQTKKLQKLLQHSYSNVPFYKRYFDENKIKPQDIKSAKDLSVLPIMTKQEIKNNVEELKGVDNKRLKKVTSGGSTGETAIIYKSPYFLQISHAFLLRNMTIANWMPNDKSAWIWGAPYENQQIKNSLISKFSIFINQRLFFNAYNYSPNDFPVWANKIELFKPKVLYGYSTIILEFAKWCLKSNISFGSIRTVVSTTEKLVEREIIEKAFKCKVYDHYGSREVLSMAVECEKGSMHISDDSVIIEQLEDNSLAITALDSFDFPIIRYKIGDIGRKLEKTCSCKLNFSLMDLDIGRETDNFIKPGGMKIASSALATYISTLNVNFIKYQLIQKEINKFEIRFITNSDSNENDKEKFIKALEKYFGNVKADFIKVDNISPEPSGKKLLYKCLVNN